MITPVTPYEDLFLKREDFFTPYQDIPVSGSKIRQCRNLISANLDYLRMLNKIPATACSAKSPQGMILARVCKEFEIPCRVYIGGIPEHRMHKGLVFAEELGAEIIYASKVAYNSAIDPQIKKDKKNFYIGFGFEKNLYETIPCISEQVENVLTFKEIIVPVGSGVTAAGILLGLIEQKYSGNVRLVQIAGYDRVPKIIQILGNFLEIRLEKRKGKIQQMSNGFEFSFEKFHYPYYKTIYHPFLDTRYESKALKHLKESGYSKNALFWVIGKNSNLNNE